MNDFESMAFTFPPSVPIFSDVFGSELSNEDNVMNANDVELHGILDDIGFFEADDEESMLLPTSEIVQTDIMFVASNGDSARVSPLVTKSSLIESVGALSSPAFVSSHDLVVSEQQNESSWKTIPVTVSSSSVASKVAPLKPLSLPNYYLATNKFSMTTNTNIPLAPIPVSPTMSGRPRIAVTGVTSAPATAALAALAAKPTACEANTSKKRRLSDIQSDSWVSEEDVEIRRERNRVHAKKSRQRKKCLTHTLEDSLQALKSENAKLRETIYQVIGKAKTNEILEQRTMDAHNRFIDCVKNSLIVDKKTSTFLRGLRKKVQATKVKGEKKQQQSK